MTISQPVPPALATPYAPSWMRYVYDDIAYMTQQGVTHD